MLFINFRRRSRHSLRENKKYASKEQNIVSRIFHAGRFFYQFSLAIYLGVFYSPDFITSSSSPSPILPPLPRRPTKYKR